MRNLMLLMLALAFTGSTAWAQVAVEWERGNGGAQQAGGPGDFEPVDRDDVTPVNPSDRGQPTNQNYNKIEAIYQICHDRNGVSTVNLAMNGSTRIRVCAAPQGVSVFRVDETAGLQSASWLEENEQGVQSRSSSTTILHNVGARACAGEVQIRINKRTSGACTTHRP